VVVVNADVQDVVVRLVDLLVGPGVPRADPAGLHRPGLDAHGAGAPPIPSTGVS
jgi:hypothetical protein